MSENAGPSLVKRSLTIAGHRTSITLENEFWTCLKSIAGLRRLSLAALVADIDRQRGSSNLSSAIRLFVLAEVQRGATPSA